MNHITIPVFAWKQIGGDVNPGAHGGIIACADGTHIEIREIQPARAFVGDREAADVGYPFWSKEGWYDVADLNPENEEVRRALECCGVDLQGIEPEHMALCIAECLFAYGAGSDEGPCGWAEDVVPHTGVKWWSNDTVAGADYLSDEDLEFAQMLAEHGAEMCDKARKLLTEWLSKSLESDVERITECLSDIQSWCVKPCGECAACERGEEFDCEGTDGEPTSIDVRLQVSASGTWDIHSGDACYDTDHSGCWGTSSVNHEDTAESLSETARDLIEQVLEGVAT